MRALVAAGALLAAFTLTTTAGGSVSATAAVRLDDASIRPEIAKTPAQRARGLMNRRQVPRDGMLFVFPETTRGGFWMKNTLVPLTIIFFDSAGNRVRQLSMTPCGEAPCRIYYPGRPYRFALELHASDTRSAARIGPLAALRRLTRVAS